MVNQLPSKQKLRVQVSLPAFLNNYSNINAHLVEVVDTADLKSAFHLKVLVQVQ